MGTKKFPENKGTFRASVPTPFTMRRRTSRQDPDGRRSFANKHADELARLAARGDADAFSQLCLALRNDVWRYCWSLTGSGELADEATQETFLRATTAISRFRGDAPVRVWFIVLARRSVGETLRQMKRSPVPAEPVTMAVRDHTGAVDLAELIEALPSDSRQAFVLTQMLGFSYADAAVSMDCPVGTIRSRVFRAKAALVSAWNCDEAVIDEEACE